ncbi:ribbon-helix-helix domain-containing protein [Corynebacterium afermentans]
MRVDDETIAALMARAEAEGLTTRSDAIREAIRQWTGADLRS